MPPSPRTPHPGQAAGIALGGLLALAAAMGIGRFVYTPILPFMVEALPLGPAQAGLIASANFLGYLLGALAASRGVLPGGARRWFLLALAVSALSTAAIGLTDSTAAFLLLRFVGGVASAYVLVLASLLVLERLGALRRPSLAGVHFAGVGAGIALSAVLVAGCAALGLGWRAQWLGSGVLAGLALLAVRTLVPPQPEAALPAGGSPPATGGASRALRVLIVAYGLFGFGYVITATFLSTMVRTVPALRVIEPVVWLTVGLAAVPSVPLWTGAGRRWGNARAFAVAAVVEALGVALSVLADSPAAVLLAAALLGGTFMGLTALGLVQARALSSAAPRRSLALMTAAFGLGQMIGPSYAGALFRLQQSFLLPSLTASAALFLAAALVLWRGEGR